jgi:hypothetical protein
MGSAFSHGWVGTDRLCSTFRTGNELLWSLSGKPQAPWMSRCLHPLERAYLRGLPQPPSAASARPIRWERNDCPCGRCHAGSAATQASTDACLHEHWSRAEEPQALVKARATTFHHIQALAELNSTARTGPRGPGARRGCTGYAAIQRQAAEVLGTSHPLKHLHHQLGLDL